jgi:hypothetical protein
MTLKQAILALALAGTAAAAQAGVKASALRPGNWVSLSAAEVLVPVNAAGATTLSFTLPSAGKKILTYSAECAVDAPAGVTGTWLSLDIYVNGVVVSPTIGTTDPFCPANGTMGFDGYVRASITIPIQGKSGSNTIQIKARGGGSATGLWLGDSALVIYD